MTERFVAGFFYGLFMDARVLRELGASPANPRRAYVEGFRLRIGSRATLVPRAGSRVYGMVIGLTHSDLERLYAAPGLDGYRPEAVLAHCLEGETVPALCYNLPDEPRSTERNAAYAARLQNLLRELKFPAEYIDSVIPG